MKTRALRIAGLIVIGLLLAFIWFLQNFERVPTQVHTPPGREARDNPYLALERLIAASGHPLRRSASADELGQLPASGVLLLVGSRQGIVEGARLDSLLAWVAAGGYLIVTPQAPGRPDPLLRRFEVNCDCAPKTETKPAPAVVPKQARRASKLAVELPGRDAPLQISPVWGQLQTGRLAPAWQAGLPGESAALLHFAHGRGQITMISQFRALYGNQAIGQHDHAALLWHLLQSYAPTADSPVILYSQLGFQSLWAWLGETAWMATLAGATLLALWLWAVVPRFGPLETPPSPARRQLGEHLAAVGRCLWRLGGLAHWLEIARASLRARLAVRHPQLLELPPAEQAQALARLSGRPAALIANALHEPVGSPQSFTQAVRLLRNLEHSL